MAFTFIVNSNPSSFVDSTISQLCCLLCPQPCPTTKFLQHSQVRLDSTSNLVRCTSIQSLCQCAILQPDSMPSSLAPEKLWLTTCMEQGMNFLEDCAIESFGNSIVLRRVVNGKLVYSSSVLEVKNKFFV